MKGNQPNQQEKHKLPFMESTSLKAMKYEIQKPSTYRAMFRCKFWSDVSSFSPCMINASGNNICCGLKKVVAKSRAHVYLGFVAHFSSNSQLVTQQICSCCMTSCGFLYLVFCHLKYGMMCNWNCKTNMVNRWCDLYS